MGNCCGSIFKRRKLRRHIVLLLIGLDNAGKTKTVNNLAGEKDDKVLPTVGFKAVNLVHKDTPVTIYDLGGGSNFRQIWSQYYSEVHGIIFVIDSSDFSRLEECKAVLEEVLSHDKISGKPVLILANKQDKSGALDDIDMVEKLNIEPLVNRYRCPTLVESYSANIEQSKKKKLKIDPGLKKGYQWLLNYITRRYGDINLRVQTDIHADLERRTRMIKASNRASQTFTTVSDDIATQTGFENPNYALEKLPENDNENHINDVGKVIVVKPITHKPNSVDTTITIESLDETDTSGGKPKLSPLFGASSSSTTDMAPVELEPRTEFRKLSPIVRNKSGANRHIDFMNRGQSIPTSDRTLKGESTSTQNSSIQEEGLKLTAKELNMQFGDVNGWNDVKKRRGMLVKDADLMQLNKEVALTDRDHLKMCSSSAAALVESATLPTPRPASASQIVRRHLELTSMHKRRLSLRHFPHMHRNKTSPEHTSLFLYEPKSSQRNFDKGDFEHKTA